MEPSIILKRLLRHVLPHLLLFFDNSMYVKSILVIFYSLTIACIYKVFLLFSPPITSPLHTCWIPACPHQVFLLYSCRPVVLWLMILIGVACISAGLGVIYCRMDNSPRATHLKRISLHSRNHCLWIVPHIGDVSQTPSPILDGVYQHGLALCRQPQLLRIHKYNGYVRSRR